MTATSSAAGAAHNATVSSVSNDRVGKVVRLCLGSMSGSAAGGLTNADTIAPTDVLDLLGVDYGPGSVHAEQFSKE